MVTHFIFLSSSYSKGTRIGLDYIVTGDTVQEKVKEDLKKIIDSCGRDVSISTHMIQAKNEEWEAVVEADHYFKDVKVIETLNEFIKLIKEDRTLKGIDVAKYVLSKVSCTQLKLQKLVYLCFADYLCKTGKPLFTDPIYALKYGPVVDTVYKKYKEYGYKPIEEETTEIDSKNISEMPERSRILFAEDGIEKMLSIENTIKKYGDFTASMLVDLTHRSYSPWSMTEKTSDYKHSEIKLQTIKDYHKYETI